MIAAQVPIKDDVVFAVIAENGKIRMHEKLHNLITCWGDGYYSRRFADITPPDNRFVDMDGNFDARCHLGQNEASGNPLCTGQLPSKLARALNIQCPCAFKIIETGYPKTNDIDPLNINPNDDTALGGAYTITYKFKFNPGGEISFNDLPGAPAVCRFAMGNPNAFGGPLYGQAELLNYCARLDNESNFDPFAVAGDETLIVFFNHELRWDSGALPIVNDPCIF